MSKEVVFAGWSYTAGAGWSASAGQKSVLKEHPNLWVNLCHKNIQTLRAHTLVNLGQTGASNTEIFENVMHYMSARYKDIDTFFVQWTSAPRYNFNVGLELWDTSESMDGTQTRVHDVKLSDGTMWSRDYIRNLLDRLRVMHHLHWEILKIVKYTNIILSTAKALNIKNVFFINGICPWDKNYFVKLENTTPDHYTDFTKNTILQIDTRSDSDIQQLYHQIHSQYNELGGLNENHWINLYGSFYNQTTDTNYDNLHPGTQSNQLFYQIISNWLNKQTI